MDTRYSSIGGEICQNCGRRYKICWKVSDEIWLKVIKKETGLLCPSCFDIIAAMQGYSLAWEAKKHPIYS